MQLLYIYCICILHLYTVCILRVQRDIRDSGATQYVYIIRTLAAYNPTQILLWCAIKGGVMRVV